MIENFINTIKPHISFCEVRTILDIGSRDLNQSVEFRSYFPAVDIYAFEPNREMYDLCSKNAKEHNIHFIPKAVTDYDGEITFYPIAPDSPIHNPGASSVRKITPLYKSKENLKQAKTVVSCCRIDTWAKENNIDEVSLVWLDLQGATYEALEGFGDLLSTVRAIQFEAEFQELYEGEKLYPEIDKYLTERGFKCIHGNFEEKYVSDFIYLSNTIK